MNDASQWRIALTQKIAPVYAAIPAVEAVVLIGGVARGRGDAYSDIDLAVYWSRPPTEAERRSAQQQYSSILQTEVVLAELRANPLPGYPGGDAYLWEEAAFIGGDEAGGFKIDVTHEVVAVTDWIIDDVTLRYDTGGGKLERLYSIQRVFILYGEPLIRSWQARAKNYPNELVVKLVETHLGQLRFDVALHQSRGDLLLFYQTLTSALYNLLGALLALNQIYRPEYKRLAALCNEMPLKPAQLSTRINVLLRANRRRLPRILTHSRRKFSPWWSCICPR